MFRSDKPEVGTFRADYAQAADFYQVLQRDIKPLYLLVFLLTANHRQAEQCFASTVENLFQGQFAFKEFTRSWIKRCMIRNAIGIVCPASASSGEQRDLWSPRQQTSHRDGEINSVTQLAPLERFVFVMSILERYSVWECSLLLNCGTKKAAQAQLRALRRLTAFGKFRPEVEREYCTRGLSLSDQACSALGDVFANVHSRQVSG